MRKRGLLAVVVVAAAPVWAEELVFSISDGLEMEVCYQSGFCDSTLSGAEGEITLDVDFDAGTVALVDTMLALDPFINVAPSDGLGTLNVQGQSMGLLYGNPGTPDATTLEPDGSFDLAGLSTSLPGDAVYNATSTVCNQFIILGYPCNDFIELPTLGVINATMANGTLNQSGSQVDLTYFIDVQTEMFPSNPGLASIRVFGQVSGTAEFTPMGCPNDPAGDSCDTDIAPEGGDCIVNNQDLGALLASYLMQDGDPDYNAAADFTGDNRVDNNDLGELLADYLNNCQ